jgi:hypothetical protein
MSDTAYEAFPSALPSSHFKPIRLQPQLTPYQNLKSEGRPMAAKSDAVTWGQFGVLIGAALGIATITVGGGFAWMHSDLSDLKVEIHQTRTDLTNAIGEVAKQAATTNGTLNLLVIETQRNGGRRP